MKIRETLESLTSLYADIGTGNLQDKTSDDKYIPALHFYRIPYCNLTG
jgi:hypothetical protein